MNTKIVKINSAQKCVGYRGGNQLIIYELNVAKY